MNTLEQSAILIEFLEHLERLKLAIGHISAKQALEAGDSKEVRSILDLAITKQQPKESLAAMQALSELKGSFPSLFMITLMSILTCEVTTILGTLDPGKKEG